jgi:hypothetical protein
MGKSRLLHEFRQRVERDRAFILSGSCSPDGRQTPFLPFIEVVRSSFQVSAGEAEKEVARKLEMGLTVLGLHSLQNLGLLLNLLGLKPPESALTGLDGLLIGLRTRDLLQALLAARRHRSPVILLLEDLHWIDSASEEVLGRIIDGQAKLRLLLLHTRRPEYHPGWLDRPIVTKLQLVPLAGGDIEHLVRARLGVELLPEALALLVTGKAEGNALFAEEIVSFLSERGALRTNAGLAEFDAGGVAATLPASVQGLLTARVDRLVPRDRALLQAAAVIGRRFDPQLLASVCGETDIHTPLTQLETIGLIHAEGKSGDYLFKHALVRDAVYQGLLGEARATLHSKIAAEIERRNDNRLIEVAETLAYHYSRTNHDTKAFAFLSMAGTKSLGVYSLEEATAHLAAAFALLEKNPRCVLLKEISRSAGLTMSSLRNAWAKAQAKAKCTVEPDAEQRDDHNKRDRQRQADILIQLARDADLFHVPDGTGYADLKVHGHRETWPIRSKGVTRWLLRRFFETTGGTPNSEALQSALSVLEAKAHFDAPERTVHVRVAGLNNKAYLDLCDRAWRAIEIDGMGWKIIEVPPVRFRRASGMHALPVPVSGGSLKDLRPFLNVRSRGDRAALLGWTKDELYRVPRLWSRIDLTGAALLVGLRHVVAVTAENIAIESQSGSRLKFRRIGREHVE